VEDVPSRAVSSPSKLQSKQTNPLRYEDRSVQPSTWSNIENILPDADRLTCGGDGMRVGESRVEGTCFRGDALCDRNWL
jgi:hypothetical protein